MAALSALQVVGLVLGVIVSDLLVEAVIMCAMMLL